MNPRTLRSHLLPSSWFWITMLAGAALFGCSDAEVTFAGLHVGTYVIGGWGMMLLVRFSVWLTLHKLGRGRVLAHPWLSWSIEPVICLLLIGLIATGGLRWTRFAISYPWLHAKATRALEKMKAHGPQDWNETRHIYAGKDELHLCGLYRILGWETGTATDGSPQFLILTADNTLTDGAGWTYVPSGAAPKGIRTPQPCYFEHMTGGWWRWRVDF